MDFQPATVLHRHITRYHSIDTVDPEERIFWKTFKTRPALCSETVGITSVAYSHGLLAVASATRIQIFKKDGKLDGVISKSKEPVTALAFRDDGKLLAAGNERGEIFVFDARSRSLLRHFTGGHSGPVRSLQFSGNRQVLISCSDDKSIRLWDIPADTAICSLINQHRDYVRSISALPQHPSLFLSGSYDHRVILWSVVENGASILHEFDHGCPVEAVLLLPGAQLAISAGSNSLNIWDLVQGRLERELLVHQKTITSLALFGPSRLLTGSLDRHVKVVDLSCLAIVASFKMASPVQSLAASPTALCVGMVNGEAVERVSKRKVTLTALPMAPKILERSIYDRKRSPRLRQFEKCLKKFQYRDALDVAFKTGDVSLIHTALLELIRMGDALKIALSGRDEEEITQMITFFLRHLNNILYQRVIFVGINTIIEIYSSVVGTSALVDQAMVKLNNKIQDELRLHLSLHKLTGILEMYSAN